MTAVCPSGRTKIEGTIVSAKMRDTPYGMKMKMLVEDDLGFKAWGSVPADIELFQIPLEEEITAREVHVMNRVRVGGGDSFSVSRIVPEENGVWLYSSDLEAVFVDDEHKVKAVWWEQRSLARGDRVKFTATVTPSNDDAQFGFFKRPSGASVIGGKACLQNSK